MLTYICSTRNWQLLLILTLWNYFKSKYLLQTFNLYKIPAKEYHLVDRWAAENISFVNIISEIFRICPPNITELQNPKEDENFHILNFSFFKCPILLNVRSTIIFEKKKKCPRNTTFLYIFLYKIQNRSP